MTEAGSHPDSRKLARVAVDLKARFRVLDPTEHDAVRRRLMNAPSVWAPSDEASLLSLAASGASGTEALLARGLLDVCDQVRRLSYRVLASVGPMEAGQVVQVSGSGCQMSTRILLRPSTCLELQIEDDDDGVPPVRVVAEVVHAEGPAGGRYGLRFNSIHPTDQERLIRYLYRMQRRTLRETHLDEP